MGQPAFDRGLQSLNRKLIKKLPESVYKKVRAALEESANQIVYQMKRHAPVDSGDLQMSIQWCWGNAPKGAMVIGQLKTRGRGSRSFSQGKDTHGLRISIFAGGDDQYYAWFVEFGTQLAAAHPFFFPIYRANKRSAKARITRAITKGVKDGVK